MHKPFLFKGMIILSFKCGSFFLKLRVTFLHCHCHYVLFLVYDFNISLRVYDTYSSFLGVVAYLTIIGTKSPPVLLFPGWANCLKDINKIMTQVNLHGISNSLLQYITLQEN